MQLSTKVYQALSGGAHAILPDQNWSHWKRALKSYWLWFQTAKSDDIGNSPLWQFEPWSAQWNRPCCVSPGISIQIQSPFPLDGKINNFPSAVFNQSVVLKHGSISPVVWLRSLHSMFECTRFCACKWIGLFNSISISMSSSSDQIISGWAGGSTGFFSFLVMDTGIVTCDGWQIRG